jgi:hypothetical protein
VSWSVCPGQPPAPPRQPPRSATCSPTTSAYRGWTRRSRSSSRTPTTCWGDGRR